MKMFKPRLAVLCLALALVPQICMSQNATANTVTDDAAAEAKARNYFTDLTVIDQNGKQQRFYSDILKQRVVLLNFIFTSCESACPMLVQKLKTTRALMADSIKDDVWFVSISIDPERDTPEAMKKFAKKHGVDESRWVFLTGDKKNLDLIIKKLGQYTPDIEAHSTLMLAGNTKTRHWTRVMPMIPPEGIAMKMRALVEESPG